MVSRKSMEGQSIFVGLFKLIGATLASPLFCTRYRESALPNTLYLTILPFDGIDMAMLWSTERRLGRSPWARWQPRWRRFRRMGWV